jgi:hypothetical protein
VRTASQLADEIASDVLPPLPDSRWLSSRVSAEIASTPNDGAAAHDLMGADRPKDVRRIPRLQGVSVGKLAREKRLPQSCSSGTGPIQ